jgi:hypothetical protein
MSDTDTAKAEGQAAEVIAAVQKPDFIDRFFHTLTPADGLCNLCRGSGTLVCFQDGNREFWECPACKGIGARKVFAPAEYRTHAR